jgi:hypothetical protein
MRAGGAFTLVVRVLACVSLTIFATPASIQAQSLVPGPAQAGNGFPNGLGATLGCLYLRATGLTPGDSEDVALELFLSSSRVEVEPVSCSARLTDACAVPARGIADVSGNPSLLFGSLWNLKLAGALYLSPDLPPGLAGASVEVALEGALAVRPGAPVGSPVSLRLHRGQAPRLLNWAGKGPTPSAQREYTTGTGTALLVEDVRALFFPGLVRGDVLENNGHSLLIRLTGADLESSDIHGDTNEIAIQPDPGGASSRGLPSDAFGLIEINYSGSATHSAVIPGALSNDVELTLTAVERESSFIRGDCNGDGRVPGSPTDALFLLNYAFVTGPAPRCLQACDANHDGQVLGTVLDSVYLLQFSFLGGPAPPSPYPDCGPAESGLMSCTTPTCSD